MLAGWSRSPLAITRDVPAGTPKRADVHRATAAELAIMDLN
jgi:hypothetical protein